MTIRAECPGCGRVYNLDDSKAGRSGKCKDCGSMFQVPDLDDPFEAYDDDFGDIEDDGVPLPAKTRVSPSAGKSKSSGKKKRSSSGSTGDCSNLGLIIGGVVAGVLFLCGGGGYLAMKALPRARQAALAQQEKSVKWSRFSPPNGMFSCEMMERPSMQTRVAPGGFTVQAWIKKVGRLEVTVGFMDMSSIPPGQFDAETALAAATQGGASSVGGTIVSDTPLTFQGHPSRDYVVTAKGMTIRGRTIYANQRVILQTSVFPTGNEPSDSMRIFNTLVIE